MCDEPRRRSDEAAAMMGWSVMFTEEPERNNVQALPVLAQFQAPTKLAHALKSPSLWSPEDTHIIAPSVVEGVDVRPQRESADVVLDFVSEYGEGRIEYGEDVSVDFCGPSVEFTYFTNFQDVLRAGVAPLTISRTGSIVDLKWLMRSPYAWLGLIRRLTNAATYPYTLYELYVSGRPVFVTFALTLRLHGPGDVVLIEQPGAQPRLVWFR